LGGLGAGLGGLATVLGLGFEGYAKDQARRVEEERNRKKDLADAQMLKIQMAEHEANTESRKAATKLAQNKALIEQNAYAQLAQDFPDHPDVKGGYIEGGTYSDSLKAAKAERAAGKSVAVALAALGNTFPKDAQVQALVKAGYQPGMTMDSLKEVWDSANERYKLANAYHPPPAQSVVWVHDATTNTDVPMSKDAVLSAPPGRFTKPGGAGAGALSKLPAPLALRVGQFGEMLKKSDDLRKITEGLSVNVGQSAAQDVAEHGFKIGGLAVPGSRAVGSWLANRSNDYATYQAVLTPFVTAAAHAIGGARVNQTQIDQIRNSIEIKPGDSPELKATKAKNMFDLINSTGGALPAEAIAVQEAQMDPAALAALREHGYRGGGLGGQQEPLTVAPPPPPKVTAESTAAKPPPAPGATDVTKMTDRQLWDMKARTPQGLKWLTDHHIPRPPGP